jgi:hypothetical protein
MGSFCAPRSVVRFLPRFHHYSAPAPVSSSCPLVFCLDRYQRSSIHSSVRGAGLSLSNYWLVTNLTIAARLRLASPAGPSNLSIRAKREKKGINPNPSMMILRFVRVWPSENEFFIRHLVEGGTFPPLSVASCPPYSLFFPLVIARILPRPFSWT